MATNADKDPLDCFDFQYEQKLPSLLRKLSVTEDESTSQFRCLPYKRRQARLMQNAMEQKEEAFKEKMKVLTSRWKDLVTEQDQLKANMEKSERTLKENDKIQTQALQKATKKRERRMQKERELLRAKKELEALKEERQKLSKKVQKYSIFKEYLEKVVKNSQFKDIQEAIEHCEMLVETHQNLLQSQQALREMSEHTKLHLDQYKAEKEAEILQHEKELAQLQLRFDQAQRDALLWETRLDETQAMAADKTLKLGTTKMAILNLWQRANEHLKTNLNVPASDSHRQLDMVQQFIQDLTDIGKMGKQRRVQKQH